MICTFSLQEKVWFNFILTILATLPLNPPLVYTVKRIPKNQSAINWNKMTWKVNLLVIFWLKTMKIIIWCNHVYTLHIYTVSQSGSSQTFIKDEYTILIMLIIVYKCYDMLLLFWEINIISYIFIYLSFLFHRENSNFILSALASRSCFWAGSIFKLLLRRRFWMQDQVRYRLRFFEQIIFLGQYGL